MAIRQCTGARAARPRAHSRRQGTGRTGAPPPPRAGVDGRAEQGTGGRRCQPAAVPWQRRLAWRWRTGACQRDGRGGRQPAARRRPAATERAARTAPAGWLSDRRSGLRRDHRNRRRRRGTGGRMMESGARRPGRRPREEVQADGGGGGAGGTGGRQLHHHHSAGELHGRQPTVFRLSGEHDLPSSEVHGHGRLPGHQLSLHRLLLHRLRQHGAGASLGGPDLRHAC